MISGLPAGQAPLNDTSYSSQKTAAQSDATTPAVSASAQDIDTIVQISPQAQQLAKLDAAVATLLNPKEWKQQKKPKTLLDYIEEAEVRGRGPRAEEAERRRQLLGNWMPMIPVGDETGMSINVLAANLASAAASDTAESGDAAFPLPTVYVTRDRQGQELATTTLQKDTVADDKKSGNLLMLQRLLSVSDLALPKVQYKGQLQDVPIVPSEGSAPPTLGRDQASVSGIAGQGKDLKTQLLSVMNDIVAGSGFLRRQLEMLPVGPRHRHRKRKPADTAPTDIAAQVDVRFRDSKGNPDLSKMLGAVFSEQIKDKSAG
ncbi:hypothetical protein [Herbaspirillum rhizosphaerae]|uniref:hypothetical protein n=1 Tax=Herbaspirillum rhizosphaerae TaxID=346179 RepID=UPI00067CEBA9|nr:hypothetical protein [Herbaspirillum rhizosphaerae]